MKYNSEDRVVILDIEEYQRIIENLKVANNKINEIEKILKLYNDEVKKSSPTEGEVLNRERKQLDMHIKNMYEDKKITYKQCKVLKYLFEKEYFSDVELAKETKVSYSSISQWKKRDKIFKETYYKILSLKNV